MQSRYYDAITGRFISPDTIGYLGANGDLNSYNLYAYCSNNPVSYTDPSGHFWLEAAIIASGAIIGGILGAFSAVTTGGNVLESAIEGCITGAIGSACGIMGDGIGAAVLSGGLAAVVDFVTQITTQYIQNGSVDFSKLDYWRIAKTGIQTGLGTAIPAFGNGAENAVDAVGTALIWSEASVLITCADVITSNIIRTRSHSNNAYISDEIFRFAGG